MGVKINLYNNIRMNNFDTCYSCANRVLFHPNYLQKFLEKKLYCKNPDKKIIKMIHRIVPDFNIYVDYKYFDKYLKIVGDIPCSLKNLSDNLFIFENYFFQEKCDIGSYIKCNYCLNNYCQLHERISPIEVYSCYCGCNFKLELCNWCININPLTKIFDDLHYIKINKYKNQVLNNIDNKVDDMDIDETYYNSNNKLKEKMI